MGVVGVRGRVVGGGVVEVGWWGGVVGVRGRVVGGGVVEVGRRGGWMGVPMCSI